MVNITYLMCNLKIVIVNMSVNAIAAVDSVLFPQKWHKVICLPIRKVA